jgi:hypothetical protein
VIIFRIFYIFLLYSSTHCFNPSLLDENLLQDSKKTQECLFQQGFKKIFFETADHLKLCGLFLDQSATKNIKATIVYLAGFYPGTKEGMSSFYTLMHDQPYNFFMFDARGHQESQGSLFSYSSLKNYGTVEFEDVLAALKFLQQYNDEHHLTQNIIVHGICSGAFHGIKACNELCLHDQTCAQNIKAFIFDSGWLSMPDIVQPTVCAEINKRLSSTWFSVLIKPICWLTLQFYNLTFKNHHAQIPGITDCMKNIHCPILFIHCINDPYVPIQPIQNLVTAQKYPFYWWIEHNAHANFHVHHPENYAEKIKEFLNRHID